MSLARQIEQIERLGELSPKTKDAVLREIIDFYRKHVVEGDKMLKRMGYKHPYKPAIEKVIGGETTFMDEFKRLGPSEFCLYGNQGITGGTHDMESQIKLVDETIDRLYRIHSTPVDTSKNELSQFNLLETFTGKKKD
ncbi:MAG: hypothetical protein ABIB71_01050 [Candidatus Woesearchaeota archaeon]